MEIAKTIFDSLSPGTKYSEKEVKSVTGLNLGKIKDAKKWLKENNLIVSYRGRGGYFSLAEGAVFPEQEVTNTMTREEKIAAAREEKKAVSAAIQARRSQRDRVADYAKSKYPEADNVQAYWYGGNDDYFYVYVWKGKTAEVYGCYSTDIEE